MFSFLFYLFAVLVIISALAVVSVRNPVYAVLSLIFAFFNAAALFIMIGAELLAMLLIIVYVGAVAVLFLFVIMMLDIDHDELQRNKVKNYAWSVLFASIFLVSIALVVKSSHGNATYTTHKHYVDNVREIGRVLYTKYMPAFHLAGVLLLVSIVGALTLTMRTRLGVKRQDVYKQLTKSPAVYTIKPNVGEGVEWKN